jgi:ribosomal RNA-processing protein 7
MKETRKLKKSNLPKEETVGKKIQRKKNEKVSNVELSEDPQAAQLQAKSSEKPNRKKIQKGKEIKSSPADGKLSGKMKKRKEKVGNVDISEPILEGEFFCFWQMKSITELLDSGIEFSISGSCYSYFN